MSGSRAAVFAHQTKSVEVYVENAWWPGSILGWRHDGEGACSVWVRVMAAGVDREIWTGLSDLRLPQVRPVPTFVPVAGVEPLPAASAAPVLSLSEAAARERLVAGVFSAPELSTVGESASRATRRRRHGGDVTAELPAVHGRASAGRHRASAGRHRADDVEPQLQVAGRAQEPDATVLMPRAEVDCLTRPLRFGDRLPRPRIPRPDGVVRA